MATVTICGQFTTDSNGNVISFQNNTPNCSATTIPIPTSTPTPIIDPNAIKVNSAPPITAGNPVRLTWSVDSSTAAVNVTIDGVALPNQAGLSYPYTVVYRVNGNRITPSLAGTAVWTPQMVGPHKVDYIAYDDNGNQVLLLPFVYTAN